MLKRVKPCLVIPALPPQLSFPSSSYTWESSALKREAWALPGASSCELALWKSKAEDFYFRFVSLHMQGDNGTGDRPFVWAFYVDKNNYIGLVWLYINNIGGAKQNKIWISNWISTGRYLCASTSEQTERMLTFSRLHNFYIPHHSILPASPGNFHSVICGDKNDVKSLTSVWFFLMNHSIAIGFIE